MWSFDLFIVELMVIIFGRLLGTIAFVTLLSKCGLNSGLTMKELIFIWYAGMIRGAIAFGLVLRIDDSFVNRNVIVTTSLSLVVFTTVIFGSTVGLISKCLIKKDDDDDLQIEVVNETTSGEPVRDLKNQSL